MISKYGATVMIPSRFSSNVFRIGKLLAINAAIFVFLLLLMEGMVRLTPPQVQPLGEDTHLFAERGYGPIDDYAANVRGRWSGAEFVADDYGRRVAPGETTSHCLGTFFIARS